ncbi:uncharacterized protein zgc:101716 isoform X3 [Pristis pectinata]|uniref:uncharacterized protein zgc:101716 isoform X3 n=1 Tax=Pristis pectinata TaxID=685728 RepID=UPI00223D4DA1|nr:uncharacterized protein zgc:101716 isoform X3 [Pristis pectinata]
MAGMVKAGDRKECRCWHQEQQTNCWRNSVGRAVSVEGNGLSMFQWFWDDISTADDVEKLTALKFRGDLAFKRQDYQKALCEYTSSLALVPDTNIALRRDLQEARARCLSYLGREEDALHIAQKLRTEVTNTDHLTTVLNLNIQIYRNAGNLTQEICCLQQLISLHPLNPWYWKKLAEAYLGLVQALSSPTVPSVPDCKDGHCLRTSLQPARQAESSKTGPDCAQLQNVNKRSSMSVVCERQSICPAHVSTEENSVLMLTGSRKAPGNVSSSYSTFGINLETESKIGGELRDQWLFACSSFVRARQWARIFFQKGLRMVLRLKGVLLLPIHLLWSTLPSGQAQTSRKGGLRNPTANPYHKHSRVGRRKKNFEYCKCGLIIAKKTGSNLCLSWTIKELCCFE